jgi:hypothetical protein
MTDNRTFKKLGYSIREACEVSSLGRTKIYSLLSDPNSPLTAVRIGGRTVILAESLQDLISRGR